VPTICTFYGIIIRMYWQDHLPPHFHALHGNDEAAIDINSLVVIAGSLSGRALALVVEWAQANRAELLENWNLCSQNQQPNRIPPLA
jgi:hypothetical protein